MRPLRAVTCLAAIAFAAAGCQSPPAPTATPLAPGEALYVKYCAVCHGEDGRSASGMLSTPNLGNQAFLRSVDDTVLRASTMRGRPGESGRGKPGTKMSAFGQAYGGPLTDAEVDLIVAHIRSWQKEPSIALAPYTARGDATAGAKVYSENCESCHGSDGWGTVGATGTLAPALAGATFQELASDAFIRHTALNGRLGTTMPAFKLTDTQVDDLVSHIRTLGVPTGGAQP